MLRGYRGILVALAGLALCGAQPPQEKDQNSQSDTPAEQAHPAAQFTAYPGYNPDPCYQAKDHDAADLCAQWRAAIAAEKAAHEARRATTWSIVATFLSAISLLAVAVALWLTVQSNRIARRIGEAQVRAYLTVQSVEMTFRKDGAPEISLVVKNSGNSPAISVRPVFRIRYLLVASAAEAFPDYVSGDGSVSVRHEDAVQVAAGDTVPIPPMVLEEEFGDVVRQAIFGQHASHVWVTVSIGLNWKDVFKLPQTDHSAWTTTGGHMRKGVCKLVPHNDVRAKIRAEWKRRGTADEDTSSAEGG